MGGAAEILGAVGQYARLAWWGLVEPRFGRSRALLIVQAVILREAEGAGESPQVLLSVRSDLRGWELPGGTPEPEEDLEVALVREVGEETGLRVEVVAHVGDYVRTGFRPHTARVYRVRVRGGAPRASSETPVVRWFDCARLPGTLFPWYRQPLCDALCVAGEPVERHDRQGASAIWAGLRIDLRMRASRNRAGLPAESD